MTYGHYVVLCEDLQAWVFARRALIASGAVPRNIRYRPFPDGAFQQSGGKGPRRVDGYVVYPTGSHHVRENFPNEIAALRHGRRPGKLSALVVHIDVDNTAADGRTVDERVQELTRSCEEHRVMPPTPTEPLALLVARRNIETWIANLSGATVDEHTEYPKLKGHEADADAAAISFAKHAAAGTAPPNASPSLARGLKAMRHVI